MAGAVATGASAETGAATGATGRVVAAPSATASAVSADDGVAVRADGAAPDAGTATLTFCRVAKYPPAPAATRQPRASAPKVSRFGNMNNLFQ